MTAKWKISASKLESFRLLADPEVEWMTPERYKTQLLEQPTEESQFKMDNGTAVHQAIEAILGLPRDKWTIFFDGTDFNSYYETIVEGNDLPANISVEMTDGLRKMINVVRDNAIGPMQIEESYDKELELPRHGTAQIRGKVDVYYSHQVHGSTVLDWKTTERKPVDGAYSGSMQGLVYQWLTEADRISFVQAQVAHYRNYGNMRCVRVCDSELGLTDMESRPLAEVEHEIMQMADDMIEFAKANDCAHVFKIQE